MLVPLSSLCGEIQKFNVTEGSTLKIFLELFRRMPLQLYIVNMVNHNLSPRLIFDPSYVGNFEFLRKLFLTIPNNMPNISCNRVCVQARTIDCFNHTKIVIVTLNRLQLYDNMSREVSAMVRWFFMNYTTLVFWVCRNSIWRRRITSINQKYQFGVTQLHISKIVLNRLLGSTLLYYLVAAVKYLLDEAIQLQKSFRSSFKLSSILF
ncbi:hypothetical protein IPC1576_25060 [Pseudomonas aeruginosa]|nr:hypothetical protein IPC1576_25060 [Pseudomonas aeruginosa]